MSLTDPLTKLEAVNGILAAVGESPVQSLGDGVDATIAETTLDHVVKRMLAVGWYFNTEADVAYVRDSGNFIQIPKTVIRADGPAGSLYTIRQSRLYDLKNHTDVFTSDVTLTIVTLLDWEDLPVPARDYAMTKAARIFADQQLGDASLSRFTRQDEAEALAALRIHEAEQGDYTVYGPGNSQIIDRGSPLDRIRT